MPVSLLPSPWAQPCLQHHLLPLHARQMLMRAADAPMSQVVFLSFYGFSAQCFDEFIPACGMIDGAGTGPQRYQTLVAFLRLSLHLL